MAATSVIQAIVDPMIQRQAEAVLERRGLTIAAAIELFLAQVAEDHCPMGYLHHPNAESIAAMREFELAGCTSFASVDALMADLDADD